MAQRHLSLACLTAALALTVAGCASDNRGYDHGDGYYASDGWGGYRSPYGYYGGSPYYYGRYGNDGHYHDHDDDHHDHGDDHHDHDDDHHGSWGDARFSQPEHNTGCDQRRESCHRDGRPSQGTTRQHDGNDAARQAEQGQAERRQAEQRRDRDRDDVRGRNQRGAGDCGGPSGCGQRGQAEGAVMRSPNGGGHHGGAGG